MSRSPKSSVRRRTQAFKIGDRVRFKIGVRDLVGTIVEDRGRIGAGRRQLLRVEVPVDLTYIAVYEVPAEDLQAA